MTGLMIITLVVALVACGAVFVIVDVLAGGIIKQMKKEVFRYVKQYNEHMRYGSTDRGKSTGEFRDGRHQDEGRDASGSVPSECTPDA